MHVLASAGGGLRQLLCLPRQHRTGRIRLIHPLQAPFALFRADRCPTLPFVIPQMGNIAMPENPNVQAPVEIPAVDSAHAPFLYFDRVRVLGHNHGVIRITLEALRDLPATGKQPASDSVIVAYLRMNVPAAQSLKAAIDNALLLAAPPAGTPSQRAN